MKPYKRYFEAFEFCEAVIHVDNYLKTLEKELNTIYTKLPIENSDRAIQILKDTYKEYNIEFIEIDVDDRIKPIVRGGLIKGKSFVSEDFYHIEIYYHKSLPNFFKDTFYFHVFKDTFIEILLHELTHLGQGLKMEWVRYKGEKKPKNEFEYYAKKNELMAYANLIVYELRFNGEENKDILNKIQTSQYGVEDSEFLMHYKKIYKNYPKVLNQLYKYIYEYIRGEIKNTL